MSKRVRHQPRFYATLLNDVRHSGFNSKYRPKVKPTVMGVYEVERIVAKRVQGAEQSTSANGKATPRVKIRGNQPSTYPRNSSLPSRTDLSIHFAPLNAERDQLFYLRRV